MFLFPLNLNISSSLTAGSWIMYLRLARAIPCLVHYLPCALPAVIDRISPVIFLPGQPASWNSDCKMNSRNKFKNLNWKQTNFVCWRVKIRVNTWVKAHCFTAPLNELLFSCLLGSTIYKSLYLTRDEISNPAKDWCSNTSQVLSSDLKRDLKRD